jgi:sugar O-acyltransferase (sialic acid O-acetyltransferase NeuD family)
MTHLIGVYGASGFGREVAPLVRTAHAGDTIAFIDDHPQTESVNGLPIWPLERFLDEPASRRSVVLAIGDGSVRARLDERCSALGIEPLSIEHPSVVKLDDVAIGEGAVLCSFVTITSNVRIGRCFHANIYSYVAHDCRIGDFVTFAPGVHCNGNVLVHDHAYIGTGAVIRQGMPERPLVIGEGAVVGMGAVVTKDVPAGATVVGNPARPLVKG